VGRQREHRWTEPTPIPALGPPDEDARPDRTLRSAPWVVREMEKLEGHDLEAFAQSVGLWRTPRPKRGH
jgi:hypothetical protein